MQQEKTVRELLLSENYIQVNKLLIHAIGLHETILYCELCSRQKYFADKGLLSDEGYFFNTVNDLYAGTGITEKQQRAAIKNLVKIKLLHVVVKGLPAKRYFKINDNDNMIIDLIKKGKDAHNAIKESSALKYQQLRQNGGSTSDKIAEVPPQYGRSNKNNLNKTNQEEKSYNVYNVAFTEKRKSNVSYRIFIDIIKSSIYPSDPLEIQCVKYFFSKYRNLLEEDHPAMKDEQMQNAIDIIGIHLISAESATEIIDEYFDAEMDCDYNLNHFVSGDIIQNRMYSTGNY